MNGVRLPLLPLLVAAVASHPTNATADTFVLYATDRGWYSSFGEHDPGNVNYLVGKPPEGWPLYRNWFSFSLPPHIPEILNAEVVLTVTHNISFPPGWPVKYSCWDFTGSMQDLWLGQNGLATYQDLGSGVKFGEVSLILGAASGDIKLASGPEFVSFVKTAGTNFAIGGMLSYSGFPNYAYLFGGSDTDPWTSPKLYIETVPQPPPTITCPLPLNLECTNNGAIATLEVHVEDAFGNPLEVIWNVDGAPYQTNHISSGGRITSTNVNFVASFGPGDHSIRVSASNGKTAAAICDTSVSVHDTRPPVILKTAATPSLLWPPNHTMRSVQISAEATDSCGPVTQRIVSVSSVEPLRADDWKITGDLALQLRATRQGNHGDRVYSITLEFADSSGNTSLGTVTVTVPHDRR